MQNGFLKAQYSLIIIYLETKHNKEVYVQIQRCLNISWLSELALSCSGQALSPFSLASQRSIKISCDKHKKPEVSDNITKSQKQQVRKRELMVLPKVSNQFREYELFPPSPSFANYQGVSEVNISHQILVSTRGTITS